MTGTAFWGILLISMTLGGVVGALFGAYHRIPLMIGLIFTVLIIAQLAWGWFKWGPK